MDFSTWYTDSMDVYRNVKTTVNGLTTNERQQVLTGIPCRVYQSDSRALQMQQTAAYIHQEDRLACALDVPILPGDELHIQRGALIGQNFATIRAFAADPNYYPEPVGNAMGGLAHQEIRLLQQERV